ATRALEEDSIPPGRPAGLRVESSNSRGFKLAWTALGEDGCKGIAVRYEVRYSVGDELPFDQALRQGVQVDRPGPAGTPQQATVSLPPSGHDRAVNVAVRAIDNVGNPSELARVHFTIPGVPVAFEDNFDQGAGAWSPEGTWAQMDYPGRGKVWTDSPEGAYQDNRNDSLVSPVISLRGWRGARLHFDARYTVEKDHDAARLEVRTPGGSWSELARWDGNADWRSYEYDLSDFDGRDVQVRFRLETDGSRTADGIYLDNLVVTGRRS
ncbi:MAG: hypothetical protein AB1758_10835, partial [Candidatus Eremiobacterota bacterium]